jgi:glycosyltransferase involved in cell wall biosynthesis
MVHGVQEEPLGFSFFMPFYNELDCLPSAIEELIEAFAPLRSSGLEIVLIDDGSRDGSELVADRYAEEHDVVRVVRHERNLGYGTAVCTGFRSARGRIVAYGDADLPVAPSDYLEGLRRMGSTDVMLGYPTGHVQRRLRRFYTWGYNRLIRHLFGVKVVNVNFSFKLLRREVVQRLSLDATSGFVDAQIVVEASRSGAVFAEMPVVYRERTAGRSHFDSPLAAVPTGKEALTWWLANRR